MDDTQRGINFGRGSLCTGDRFLHVNNNSQNYESYLNTATTYTVREIETFTVVKQDA